jgi:hypothetical protein
MQNALKSAGLEISATALVSKKLFDICMQTQRHGLEQAVSFMSVCSGVSGRMLQKEHRTITRVHSFFGIEFLCCASSTV